MNYLAIQLVAGIAKIETGTLPQVAAGEPRIKLILGIVFAIAGALALLMITISGLRYILSNGDPQKATQAREGLIYSLAGLAIVVAAQAIATFVISRVG